MAINWTKVYQKYKGLWVAFKDDEKTVVGSGKTARAALDQARKKGINKPIISRIPDKLAAYVGFGL